MNRITNPALFENPPVFLFHPDFEFCDIDNTKLQVLKTVFRKVVTLQIGTFIAKETILVCRKCGKKFHSKELTDIVPSGCNFGYDIIVYTGKARFCQNLGDQTIMENFAEKNISISQSEIIYLGRKFITYLSLAHQDASSRIRETMILNGGYILHLDATYEDKSPLLMTGLDSIMHIVLANCKIPSENAKDIIIFLHEIKEMFGEPLALVHDMSAAIIKAIAEVFPNILDFICHFHFLRDIGKDILGDEYDKIRLCFKKYGITTKLQRRMQSLKQTISNNTELLEKLEINDCTKPLNENILSDVPSIAVYSLICWALDGKKQGNGYGFPFDRPFLELAERLKIIYKEIDEIRLINLTENYKDNSPLHKTYFTLEKIMKDKKLWKSIDNIKNEIKVFEKLRKALRIAPATAGKGLNSDSTSVETRTIKKEVSAFKNRIIRAKGFSDNVLHKKMIKQIDKYWGKLFADPIKVETPQGIKVIQPQRTNNYAEQNFRDLKRACRKKTGNNSLGKTLKTIPADTPLVKNLNNDKYMKILLNGKQNLSELFADIDGNKVRNELEKAQDYIDRIPKKLRRMTKLKKYPEILRKFGVVKYGVIFFDLIWDNLA